MRSSTHRAFLFDLDGTLYSGGSAVAGAADTLRRLRSSGVPFRLVTNTTSRPRSALVQRMAGYGFEVSPGEIFTADRSLSPDSGAGGPSPVRADRREQRSARLRGAGRHSGG
jgi:ribonucleotide monophosphatase NagD (HAD superfamily)